MKRAMKRGRESYLDRRTGVAYGWGSEWNPPSGHAAALNDPDKDSRPLFSSPESARRFFPQFGVSSSRSLGVEVEKGLAVSPAGRFGARCEGIDLTPSFLIQIRLRTPDLYVPKRK